MGPFLEVGVATVGLVTGVVIIAYLVADTRNKIGFVAMPSPVIIAVVEALQLSNQAVLIDLGAGDGRVLTAAKRAVPAIRAIGYENNRLLRHPPDMEWHHKDLLNADLSGATHVVAYLNDQLNAELVNKLRHEMPTGGRIVTVQFELPGWRPSAVRVLERAPKYAARLFVYET